MNTQQKPQTAGAEKTLLTALLLSSPGPLVTGLSVLMSLSITQFADFLRRTSELFAVFISWWVYRTLTRKRVTKEEQLRLEQLSRRSVQFAMVTSGVILLIIAFMQMSRYQPGGNVSVGLVIAILGFITNSYFWLRYRSMQHDSFSIVVKGQEKLYQAKSAVDLCVVIALSAVAIAPMHPATKIIDLSGSFLIAVYLIYSGFRRQQK